MAEHSEPVRKVKRGVNGGGAVLDDGLGGLPRACGSPSA